MSIAAVVRSAAERHGASVALVDGRSRVTFIELADRVGRLADGLRSVGLTPGDRVLVLLPNSVESVEVDLALTIGGLVRVPLNPRLTQRDWARIADDCTPAALVYDPADPTASAFAQTRPTRVLLPTTGNGTTLTSIISGTTTPGALPEPDPDSLCALHYSSGTTGLPKGAQRTHRNRLASLEAMRGDVLGPTLKGDGTDVFVHAGPIIHTSGLFVLPLLEAGGRQVLLEHARPAEIVTAVARHEGTHTVLVPTVIAALLDLGDDLLEPLHELRMLAYAGAPMPLAQLRQAYRRITPNLVQYYGLVEAIPPLTVLDAADHRRGIEDDSAVLGSVGRPCTGVSLSASPDGELLVRGAAVSPGYHNAGVREDLGKSHVDGTLHTGDLGHLDAEGYVHLTGRAKDMIITGGYNVYPREVEEEIGAVPGVRDVVVTGLPDARWGQRIVAAYTADPDAEVDLDVAIGLAAQALPAYKRPKSVHRVDELPLTALGKVDRVRATELILELQN